MLIIKLIILVIRIIICTKLLFCYIIYLLILILFYLYGLNQISSKKYKISRYLNTEYSDKYEVDRIEK